MKNQTLVVDLHIEKIAKAYRSFAPADSLIYQLEVFERTLQANRFRRGLRIDFVHGTGKGTLRSELIKIMARKFPELKYEDAPFATYGFQGAIRVII
ncbi:MAG: hypothetical protein QMB82_07425 [Bacteroidales bacterium]